MLSIFSIRNLLFIEGKDIDSCYLLNLKMLIYTMKC